MRAVATVILASLAMCCCLLFFARGPVKDTEAMKAGLDSTERAFRDEALKWEKLMREAQERGDDEAAAIAAKKHREIIQRWRRAVKR